MNHKIYNQEFYATRDAETGHAARTILSIVLDRFPNIYSAIDVGCGAGTWLKELQSFGISKVHGVDGPWVQKEMLVIPEDSFECFDLQKIYKSDQQYDLLISLEVAEHLDPGIADQFIQSLTNLADCILFSAAVPHQGGQGHQNEQWQDYWASLFSQYQYVPLDIVRSEIWNDTKIYFWYKQNIILYARQQIIDKMRLKPSTNLLNMIHPELYFSKCATIESYEKSAATPLFQRVVNRTLRLLGNNK